MVLEMAPMKEMLVVPNSGPVRRGDVAVNAADNTWPVVLLGLAVVVMFILARRGARAFSFALSFNNLWSFLGVQGRFRVTVHSYKSAAGPPTCYVTTSGKFSSDLVEEEDVSALLHPDQFCISDGEQSSCRRRGVGASGGSPGLHTKMVFVHDNDGKVGAASASATCTSAGAVISTSHLTVSTPFDDDSGNGFRQTVVVEENDAEILEKLMCTVTCKDLGLEWKPTHGCPQCHGNGRKDSQRKEGSVMRTYPWDGLVKLRFESQQVRIPSAKLWDRSGRSSSPPSRAMRGTTHSATLGKNVVKIWDNPTRRVAAVLPPLFATGTGTTRNISSLDMDWEKNIAFLGGSDGSLTLWDLERANSQKTLTSLNFGSTLSSSVRTTHGAGLMFIAGRPSTGEPGDCKLCAWDPRTFREGMAAGSSVIARRSSPLQQLSISGLELSASTCCGLVSTHDIRMLSASTLSFSPAQEQNVRGGDRGTCTDAEEWWKSGVEDGVMDRWMDHLDMNCFSSSRGSQGVFSRCFGAFSSALVR